MSPWSPPRPSWQWPTLRGQPARAWRTQGFSLVFIVNLWQKWPAGPGWESTTLYALFDVIHFMKLHHGVICHASRRLWEKGPGLRQLIRRNWKRRWRLRLRSDGVVVRDAQTENGGYLNRHPFQGHHQSLKGDIKNSQIKGTACYWEPNTSIYTHHDAVSCIINKWTDMKFQLYSHIKYWFWIWC